MTRPRTAIAFLLSTICVNATQAQISTIRCPNIEMMHQSANTISDAAYVNNSYIATTQPFAIHTAAMGWFAVVYSIQATSINEAIDKARLAMLNIKTQESAFAQNLAGIYVCNYDNGKVEAINNEEDWRANKANLQVAP